jgi:hypothetical protein
VRGQAGAWLGRTAPCRQPAGIGEPLARPVRPCPPPRRGLSYQLAKCPTHLSHAVEGRAPMSSLGAGREDVDGRDKRGHDTWGACVNLFAGGYHPSHGRPPMSLLEAGCTDVDGRDRRGHDTGSACLNLFGAWYQLAVIAGLRDLGASMQVGEALAHAPPTGLGIRLDRTVDARGSCGRLCAARQSSQVSV